MDFKELKLAVEPYLNKLADMKTAGEIRDFLVGEGILAKRGHAQACAIAVYVFQGSGERVSVGTLATCPPGKREGDFLGWHTPAMVEFVANFDFGDYPELVA